MSVRVGFHLRRRAIGPPAQASALFIPERDADALLSSCARLGVDPEGRVYDVAGGFLVKLDVLSAQPVPGCVRLRELKRDLFLPVDAELVPALLDDEAAGLVRDGGLVFLPGGSVLRFDRTATIGLASLVSATPGRRRAWQPLPAPPPLADQIIEITREWPEPRPEDLYQEWERQVRHPDRSSRRPRSAVVEGSGQEIDPTPGDAGAATSGGMMTHLQDLGASLRELAGRAGAGARSLAESLQYGMRDHSSLVRKLLREFRQGDAERALRHALSMVPADPRALCVWGGDHFPFSRAIYNLFDMLGGPPRGGVVGIWRAQPDLMEELRSEYRRAAEQALRQGDYRRAAYIYGKLLGEDQNAAKALRRGGLHHDAAIIYLKKLSDKAAAADAFEAAGMVDRAVALYRELGRHEAAGDLLRRIGDEDGARAEYLLAASAARAATPPDWLGMGRILWYKARLADAALVAFRGGWDRRPAANATLCALELIAIHAARGDAQPLRPLLDEADLYFRSVGSARDAELFYNRTASAVAASATLAGFSEEMHDRSRIALAEQLRRQIQAGRPPSTSVSSLFTESTLWPSAFLRDAQFAAASAARSRAGEPRDEGPSQHPRIRVGHGAVTAACQASATAEVFLGFDDGRIFAYRPGRNQVVTVGALDGGPVVALSADPDGDILVALRHNEHEALLTSFTRQPDGSFRTVDGTVYVEILRCRLTPITPAGARCLIGLLVDRTLWIVDAADRLTSVGIPLEGFEQPPDACFLLMYHEDFYVLTHDGATWILLDLEGNRLDRPVPAWRPAPARPGRCSPLLSLSAAEGLVKVVGLDEHGAVHSSQFFLEEAGGLELLASPVATVDGGYRAATLAGPDRVVAIAPNGIEWLSDTGDRFRELHSLGVPGLAATVACFPSTSQDEILVVSAEGSITRYAIPRRWRDHHATR